MYKTKEYKFIKTFYKTCVGYKFNRRASKSDITEQLISEVLAKGYIPYKLETKTKKLAVSGMYEISASCLGGYAGKKTAPILFNKDRKKLLAGFNLD